MMVWAAGAAVHHRGRSLFAIHKKPRCPLAARQKSVITISLFGKNDKSYGYFSIENPVRLLYNLFALNVSA